MSEWSWAGVHKMAAKLALALLCIACAGCSPPTPTEAESRIFGAALRPVDLPEGWSGDGARIERTENAEGRGYSFSGPPVTRSYSAVATQHVVVYSSVDVAQDAYPAVESRWFPNSAWVAPTQLAYQSTTADQFRLSCIPVTINGVPAHSCTATGRYADMVSVLLVNVFEDRVFTWEDLEHVLQIIDQRADAQRR